MVIVGGGPGGSVCAARLRQLGRSVIVLEKTPFPHFRLGESLLPQTMHTLATIGALEKMQGRFIEKHGAQFHQDATGKPARFDFADAFDARIVHAFQVPRDAFDALLLDHARSLGAEVREQWEVTRMLRDGERAIGVEARAPDGNVHRIEASFVVDATGREALQAHADRATERIAGLDKSAFYAHYTNVARDEGRAAGDIHIPLFRGGWFWIIPFLDGRTSVGAVVSSAWLKTRTPGETPDALLLRAISESAAATRLLAGSEQLWPGRAAADFSFRVKKMTGPGWLAVGDAGGFIDPLFSTGVHMATYGGLTGADAICDLDTLPSWEAKLRAGAELFVSAVQAFYAGTLPRYIFTDNPRTYLRRAITSMLSGDVFTDERWARDMRTRLSQMNATELPPPT